MNRETQIRMLRIAASMMEAIRQRAEDEDTVPAEMAAGAMALVEAVTLAIEGEAKK